MAAAADRATSADNSAPWARLGLGTVWAGRVWPPGNQRYARPSAAQLDAQIRTALSLIPDGESLMLDTAVGYGDAQTRLGQWLRAPANTSTAARCVVATKFGEVFHVRLGRTVVDHSAAAAAAQLTDCIEALGRVDVFYSHVTSQLTPEQAAAVYADADLRAFLRAAKKLGLVRLVGTSCSFPEVLRHAVDAGHLAGVVDVVQMAAGAFAAHPDIAEHLAGQGIALVANSVVRKRLRDASQQLPASDVTVALHELRVRCPGVGVVLAGTSDADRLRHFATSLRSLDPADNERVEATGSVQGGVEEDEAPSAAACTGTAVAMPQPGGGARAAVVGGASGRLRAVLAQLTVVPGDVDANLRALEACVRRHAGHADLLVTPECFLSGYVCFCPPAPGAGTGQPVLMQPSRCRGLKGTVGWGGAAVGSSRLTDVVTCLCRCHTL